MSTAIRLRELIAPFPHKAVYLPFFPVLAHTHSLTKLEKLQWRASKTAVRLMHKIYMRLRKEDLFILKRPREESVFHYLIGGYREGRGRPSSEADR